MDPTAHTDSPVQPPVIDPLTTLGLAVFAGRGIFVPILGSGISTGAGILTGHGIMLDLIRKVATANNASADPDPVAWFKERFRSAPTYSSVLERLGGTPSERSQLIRAYFEPTEEDRAHGRKVPSQAHRALASLARSGYFRIFITVNFDPLLETALQDAGLSPHVISTPDAIEGAPPIAHGGLFVLKLNGDYRDLRIRNTDSELDEYPVSIDQWLKRVLDDFGVILCGWSGDYDGALSRSLSSRSIRYRTFWAHRGALGQKALAIASSQQDTIAIPIESADALFRDLEDMLSSLASATQRFAPSTDAIVERLKSYLQNAARRIDVEDIIRSESHAVAAKLGGADFDDMHLTPTAPAIANRVMAYEASCERLVAILMCAAYHGRDLDDGLLIDCVKELADTISVRAGIEVWLDLRLYPVMLAYYAIGTGWSARDNAVGISQLFRSGRVYRSLGAEFEFAETLHSWFVDPSVFRGLDNITQPRSAISDRIYTVLEPHASRIMIRGRRYDRAFDMWELLVSLVYADRAIQRGASSHSPPGRYRWSYYGQVSENAIGRFKLQLSTEGGASLFLRAGLFDGDSVRASRVLAALESQLQSRRFGPD